LFQFTRGEKEVEEEDGGAEEKKRMRQSRGKLWGIKLNAGFPVRLSAGRHLRAYIPEQPDLIDSLTPVFKKWSSLDPGINKLRKAPKWHSASYR